MEMKAIPRFRHFGVCRRKLRSCFDVRFKILLSIVTSYIKVENNMVLRYSDPMKFLGIDVLQCGFYIVPRLLGSSRFIVSGILGRIILSEFIEFRNIRIQSNPACWSLRLCLLRCKLVILESLERDIASVPFHSIKICLKLVHEVRTFEHDIDFEVISPCLICSPQHCQAQWIIRIKYLEFILNEIIDIISSSDHICRNISIII